MLLKFISVINIFYSLDREDKIFILKELILDFVKVVTSIYIIAICIKVLLISIEWEYLNIILFGLCVIIMWIEFRKIVLKLNHKKIIDIIKLSKDGYIELKGNALFFKGQADIVSKKLDSLKSLSPMPILLIITGAYLNNKSKMDVEVNLIFFKLQRLDALLISGIILLGLFIFWVVKLHFEYREYYEDYINYEQILIEYEEKTR